MSKARNISKLANIPSSDILASIKNVHGSQSGLDADLLDGQQDSYYLDWTNTTNKPDPVISLAGDLTGSIPNSQNFTGIAPDSQNFSGSVPSTFLELLQQIFFGTVPMNFLGVTPASYIGQIVNSVTETISTITLYKRIG